MNYGKLSEEEEAIGKAIVNAVFRIHQSLGPGLLERVYEVCMQHELLKKGMHVDRQKFIPIVYDGIEFDEALRLDLLVEQKVIVELKGIRHSKPGLGSTNFESFKID